MSHADALLNIMMKRGEALTEERRALHATVRAIEDLDHIMTDWDVDLMREDKVHSYKGDEIPLSILETYEHRMRDTRRNIAPYTRTEPAVTALYRLLSLPREATVGDMKSAYGKLVNSLPDSYGVL